MSQLEILIYIIIIQITTSIFGGHFLNTTGVVVSSGIAEITTVAAPSLLGFLTETLAFFGKMFVFGVAGAEAFTPIWVLMGVVELIIVANFLRSGIS